MAGSEMIPVSSCDMPRLGESQISLRSYQQEAVNAVRREFAAGRRSTLLVMATGCGKTIIFGQIARLTALRGGRTLILAHQTELVNQAADKLCMFGIEAGVEQAESYARTLFDPSVVVGTVQTLQRDRLQSWDPDHFNLVIIDEAHHAVAGTYRKIANHFRKSRVLGVTATADRADKESLRQVFDSVAYEFNLWDAITHPAPGPFLSRVRFVKCEVDIDLRNLRKTKEDFSVSDLEARIGPIVGTLANAIRQECGERKTVVFCPDVASSQGMATAMQSLGMNADWVAGCDPDRTTKIRRFREGDLRVLVNCQIATEGFDVPDVSAIGLCRPTKSRSLYAQMAGRGLRLAPQKSDCLLIDFNYLTDEHDLVGPMDLFDSGKMDSEVFEIANELVAKNRGMDLLDAVEQAREEKERRVVVRIKAERRSVSYRKVSYDPMEVCDRLGIPWRGSKDAVANRATEKQVSFLAGFGVEDAPHLSKARATQLLDRLTERRHAGLATAKQVSWLIAKGIDPETARAMKFAEASQTLDRLFGGRRSTG